MNEKRRKEENGPIVFYYMKQILSLYGIPDSQHLCFWLIGMNYFLLFLNGIETIVIIIFFNPNDETDIAFTGPIGWDSSVLSLKLNPTSFTIQTLKGNAVAIGIAPKEVSIIMVQQCFIVVVLYIMLIISILVGLE
jgi:hypothetical protein